MNEHAIAIAVPFAVALLYYSLAALSLAATRGLDEVATIWPSSGVLLAALLLTRARSHWYLLSLVGIASVAANWVPGVSLAHAIGLTIVNLGEAMLAAWLIQQRSRHDLSFSTLADIPRFVVATLVAAVASAIGAGLVSDNFTSSFLVSWFTTVVLGMLIVTPIILTGFEATAMRQRDARSFATRQAVLLLAIVAAVAFVVFSQSRFPLLFLPLVAVLAATYRLGPLGAAASTLIVAIIASVATMRGHGPVMLINRGGPIAVLYVQFYLLVVLISALPLGALLVTREALHRRLARSTDLLARAERSAGVGHWYVEIDGGDRFWSDETIRICAIGGTKPVTVRRALAAVHRDDRHAVAVAMREAMRGDRALDLTARILLADGKIRHVLSRGGLERRADGRMTALFGIVQDITDQIESAAALASARRRAEDAAVAAIAVADTDPLTGCASRRKILATLDALVARYEATGLATSTDPAGPITIAIFDIDHFKAVNDRFGHATGDTVLRRAVRDARSSLRAGDAIGRLGGEEFLLILPGTPVDDALGVVENVRLAIEAGAPGAAAIPITVSIGVAAHMAGQDAEALLGRADQALYEAKAAGRNTMRLAA